jgi:hypothetical protein
VIQRIAGAGGIKKPHRAFRGSHIASIARNISFHKFGSLWNSIFAFSAGRPGIGDFVPNAEAANQPFYLAFQFVWDMDRIRFYRSDHSPPVI